MADTMQKLKKAEEDATRQVDAARKDRTVTLKKAKQTAEANIKTIREAALQKLESFEKEQASAGASISELAKTAESDMALLKTDCEANKSKMVARLIDVVTSVNLSVPEARKGIKAK